MTWSTANLSGDTEDKILSFLKNTPKYLTSDELSVRGLLLTIAGGRGGFAEIEYCVGKSPLLVIRQRLTPKVLFVTSRGVLSVADIMQTVCDCIHSPSVRAVFRGRSCHNMSLRYLGENDHSMCGASSIVVYLYECSWPLNQLQLPRCCPQREEERQSWFQHNGQCQASNDE